MIEELEVDENGEPVENPFTKPMVDQSGAPVAQNAIAASRQAKIDEALKRVREQRQLDADATAPSQADRDRLYNDNLARTTVAGLANSLNFTGSFGGPKQDSALANTLNTQTDLATQRQAQQQQAANTALTLGRQDRNDAEQMVAAEQSATLKNNQDARLASTFASQQAKAAVKQDPESEESKAAVMLAEKYTRSPGAFKGKSAAQLEATLPGFAKVYEIDQKSQDHREARADKLTSQQQAAEDKKLAKTEKDREGTASQNTAAGYAQRMEQAESAFDELSKSGYNRADKTSALTSLLPGFAQSSNTQIQDQAERNFLNAVLRKESGAAISPGEFAQGAAQYFPRAGDAPEVLAQKKRNRQQSTANFKAEAGKAIEKYAPILKPAAMVPTSDKDIDNMSEAELKAFLGHK